jgi:hypothetical protein
VIQPNEIEQLCREEFRNEDGYGDRAVMKDAYRKFRDGFYCGFGQQIEGKVLLTGMPRWISSRKFNSQR